MDNWWLNPIENKEKIVYIVGSFSMDIEENAQEQFDKLNEKIDKMGLVQ